MKLTLEQMKANRKLWADALRSGEYEQGDSFLNSGTKYCCLGVLQKISGGVIAFEQTHPDQSACDWVGLRKKSGSFRGGNLVDANDGRATFAEIADIIESEPDGLFINEAY